ncbi:PKD domain-containing protein [Halostella litorea]|uniref:PKD domain-containing protein n=1 Tax=Halostella litorea TaxID=2528831 RepID=UPI0010932AB6|nr:PKD domain-containing protein [Halostella litorea]
MQFGGDERAAAIQVGATLLFGMIIVSMALYQATVVPDQNAEVEYNHNQEVQGQLQELRNAVVSVPGGGNGKAVTVDLGTRFPSRTLFVNPPAPSGSLRTVGTGTDDVNITVDNAKAAGETNDYWNGDARTFDTGAIEYEPQYSEYRNAPTTVYEQSLLYNRFDGANVTLSDQRIVDGRQITLVALNGSLSTSASGSASVSVRAVSTSQNAVAVTGRDGSKPINITIPTQLNKATWDEALSEARTDGNVVGTSYQKNGPGEFNELTIQLDGSKTYNLRMAKVGVGSGVTEETEDLYLTDVEGGGTVQTDGSQEITVEVRDRFNNPVSGETVNLSVSGSGTLDNGSRTAQEVTATSGAQGRATVTYQAPSSATTDTIEANISAAPDPDKRVSYTVKTVNSGNGSSSSAYTITWNNPALNSSNGGAALTNCDAESCTWDVGASDGDTIALDGSANDNIDNVDVDFRVNDSGVADVSPKSTTDTANGRVWTNLTGNDNGTVAVYVLSSGSSDRIDVNVENVTTSAVSASFTVSDSNPQTGQTVDFDASGSTASNGSIVSYDWDFGDGTTDSGETETHTYSSSGSYTVTLTVTDDSGRTDTATRTVQVDNQRPTASFTVSPSTPPVGESVSFDASGSSDPDGSITSYDWEFGDGTTGSGETPTHTYSAPGTYTVTLTVTDGNGASDTYEQDVTVRARGLVTAVEPDPTELDDSSGEFVRVNFSLATDTTGWEIRDDDGQVTQLPAETLNGTVYFARNPDTFASTWGVDRSKVYTLETRLANGGDPIELVDSSGTTADEFAYVEPGGSGVQTSNGWNVEVGAGEVAVRRTNADGDYIDTNQASDWETQDEGTFFGGTNAPPGVRSVTVANAPLSQSDVGSTHTVTVRFNETMNTAVAPSVGLGGLGSSGTYNSSLATNGGWVNDTTWRSEFTLADDDEDVVSTIAVADAEDEGGKAMTANTSNSVVVDTKQPNDPGGVRIVTDPISASNQSSVTVEVDVSNPDSDGGTVYVELADNDGNTVVESVPTQTGSGTVTTTITGIDVSGLNDANPNAAGGITATARIVDDLGNENPSGYTTQSNEVLKDTQPPVVREFTVTDQSSNVGGSGKYKTEYGVTNVVSDATLDSVTVELVHVNDGTVDSATGANQTVTLTDGSQCGSSRSCEYTIRITASDLAGQTTQREVTDTADGTGGSSAGQFTFSNGLAETQGSTDAAKITATNDGGSTAIIDTVVVASTSTTATAVFENQTGTGAGQYEINVDSQDAGYLDMSGPPSYEENQNRLAIGQVTPLNQSATVPSGTDATISMFEFVDDGGNTVDMVGETVTIRIIYADGSVETTTFTASDPY